MQGAGASARAEYERRKEKRADRLRRNRSRILAVAFVWGAGSLAFLAIAPSTVNLFGWTSLAILGATLLGLLVTPNHIDAWRIGAEGEERTAQALERLRPAGFEILHDRRIPGSRANIDHIVIGPTGVFVVETKSYSGRVRVRGRELYVNGHRKTADTVDEVEREVAAVTRALSPELSALGLAVRPILCFHRAEMPFLFGRSVRGVPLRTGRSVCKEIEKGLVRLSPERIAELTRSADSRLLPATTPRPLASFGNEVVKRAR